MFRIRTKTFGGMEGVATHTMTASIAVLNDLQLCHLVLNEGVV